MKRIKPPHYATEFLHRFLRADLMEEVTGDLEEKFYKSLKRSSPFRAKINYWYQVIHYLRPFAFRKKRQSFYNRLDMFSNYLKIAFRNLNKNRGYSFINIGGLAIGMAVAMAIALWIYDELSYDKYHDNYGEIVQLAQHQTFNNHRETQISMPRPLENALRTGYTDDFKYLSMSSWHGDHIFSVGDKLLTKVGTYAQEDFPEMLSLKMVEGSRKGLHDPSSILLAKSTAVALFGDKEAVNQTVRMDNKYDLKVIGVYEDLSHNTSFNDLQYITSWELYVTQEKWVQGSLTQWDNNSFQMYGQVNPGADLEAIHQRIAKVKLKGDKELAQFDPEIIMLPMRDWHLRSEWKEGVNVGGRINMVYLFGVIGSFVLLLACINFMNLSTARSEKRAKEVGIRMTIGSVRSQLINQFMSESFLVVALAFVASIGLLLLALPWFNDLADKRIQIDWTNGWIWTACLSFVLITTLLAGSYPALYLSSFQPVKVLKGVFRGGRFSSLPRKILVVVQFTVSVTLIIGTIIVYQQIMYTKDRPLGYDNNGLVMMQMKSGDFYGKFGILENELKNSGAVVEFSESSGPLTEVWSNNGGMRWEGMDPKLQPDFATIWITHDYGKTVSWKIKEGRDLSRDIASDSTGVLLNEAALKFMNVKNPIGMEMNWDGTKLHVIGVVQDMIMQSPYSPVKQAMYLLTKDNVNWINLKLNPNKPATESIVAIETVFKKLIPTAPFDYKFVDEEFAKKFSDAERIGKLSSVFAALAILISCLGLFGLASFVAEQRTKEIGIRKVLGASVINLWKMLSTDFVALVIISCFIAIPTAWYYLNDWLGQFDYRTQISWWIFAVSGAGALLITLITVSFQAIRAALMSPVQSLKTE